MKLLGCKLTLLGHIEGDVELIKRHYVHTAPTTSTSTTTAIATCTTITQANDIKMKLSGFVERDVEIYTTTATTVCTTILYVLYYYTILLYVLILLL